MQQRRLTAVAFLFVALATAVTLVTATSQTLPVVNAESIDGLFKRNVLSLVLFSRHGCDLCDVLEKELVEASAILGTEGPFIYKVEASRDTTLAIKHGVSTFPTLKMFRYENEILRPYRGGYTAHEIAEYLRVQAVHPSKELDTLEDALHVVPSKDGGLLEHSKIVIFGFFKAVDADLQLLQIAEDDIRDTNFYSFVHTKRDEIMRHYDQRSSFAIFNPAYPGQVSAWPRGETLEHHRVLDFIANNNGLPLAGVWNAATRSLYARCKKPVFRLFLDGHGSNKMQKYYERKLAEIAAKVPRMQFTWASVDDLEPGVPDTKEFESLGYTHEEIHSGAAVGVFHQTHKFRPRVGQLAKFDVDAIVEYCNSFFDKPQAPFLRSQAEPTEQTTALVTLVGSTFRNVVYDESRALFVLLHAPWCGHCKAVLPTFTALATEVSTRGAKSFNPRVTVEIAVMDADANEVPRAYSVNGYPTMYLALPGSKHAPVAYQGERTVEAFLAFLEEQLAPSKGEAAEEGVVHL